MNTNKVIFWIIWAILFILIILAAFNLNNKLPDWPLKTSWNFSIWMLWNNTDDAKLIIENFKTLNTEYSNKIITVENFSSFDDYQYALMSAIIAWKAPDIFMLNNNEKNSIFSNQAVWIDSSIINPNDFRKKFKWVFADDLISVYWEGDDIQEFLIWVPVWYETLWIFYNRQFIKNTDIETLSGLNNVIADLKLKKPNIVPIWIWNWSTVKYAADIVTQFFMLENVVTWLSDISWMKLKEWLASYLFYWDRNWYNAYDSRFMELSRFWQNSVDLFSKWETFMVVGYPSLIDEISEKWFSKNFLLASAFPHYFSWEWKTLVNYNYFVINKDSLEKNLANDFLSYLSSDIWAGDYLDKFTYQLPALLSLESDRLEEKIHIDYNVILNDFYSSDYELASFDKWIKNLYDKHIISILDNPSNYEIAFNKFRDTILCKANKIATLENLSKSCD